MDKTKLFYIVLIYICMSCTNEDNLNIVYYKKSISIDNSGDSIFFSKVRFLDISNNKLYFIDKAMSQIFEMNKDLSLSRIIGKKGDGPFDFVNLESMNVIDSMVYVFDTGRASLFSYNLQENLLDQNKFSEYPIFPIYRFIIHDSHYVLTHEGKQGAFMDFNLELKSANYWGDRIQFDNEGQDKIRNNGHLLQYEGGYIFVSDNIPVVKIYNSGNKEMVGLFDYSSALFIKSILFENENNKSCNSYNLIVEDVCIENDCLYILINRRNEKRIIYTNLILKIVLKNPLEIQEVIQLHGDCYATFCVTNDSIYAFNKDNSEIELLIKK